MPIFALRKKHTNTFIALAISYNRRRNFRGPIQEKYEINEKITNPEVRLVGEGITPGVYPLKEALKIARSMELDLVKISDKVSPPVCKVVTYSKFKYEQKKKEKKIKSQSGKQVTKEIRLTTNIGEHDFSFKKKHAIKFLEGGHCVKIYIHLRGREFYTGQDLAKEKIQELIDALTSGGAHIKQPLKLIGRRLITILDPGKTKK